MFKKILSVIALLIIGALVYAYFAPKEFEVVSKITINQPADSVFNYVKDFKSQKMYSTWVMQDPNSKLEYFGAPGTVGHKNTWDSKVEDVGAGSQEITAVSNTPNGPKQIDIAVKFLRPYPGEATAVLQVNPMGNTSEVVSKLKTSNPWPMNLMIPFIKSMLQKDVDTNCANLKKVLEQ